MSTPLGTTPVPTEVPTVALAAEPVAEATPVPVIAPPPSPTPSGPLPIGIVAGHWGNDSGAVCDGDLYEVDINLDVAQQVVYTLRALAYDVDLLEEYDSRLEGYRARALISIHADSCLYPEATGFKVARVADSAVPDLEDELVMCLVDEYGALTGLPFHAGSITPDMRYYHSFYEIDPLTPGAIIEVGFMLADRDILLNHSDVVAQGIVNGVLCFLEHKER
jgi:N-acetylmuramoyl-L-alanine amidase